jgi:hypothetical protein
MKYKITLLSLLALVGISSLAFSQNVIVKKTYYDIYQTKLKAEWQQTANGYLNGYYKEYYLSGRLYIDRLVKTEDVYPYWSYDIKCKIYDEAGGLLWSTQSIARDKYDGEQLSYSRVGPNLKLNTKAVFQNGKMISYYYFNQNGTKTFEIINGKTFKTFTSTGELKNTIDFSNGGLFTGNLYKGDNEEIKVELKDGKIQNIFNTNPTNSIDMWTVNRITGDTIVCVYNEKGLNYRKYYLDTVLVKLSYEAKITTKVSDIQNGEIGLDFGFRNNYFMVWPNKKFSFNPNNLIFAKEEKRDYGDFKLGENAVITNWEEFNENGELINSSEKYKKDLYDYNYKLLSSQKNEYLRNAYGWNKYAISLSEYRNNTTSFIYNDYSTYFYNSNGEPFYKAFKIKNSAVLLTENEADELKNLLNIRANFLSKILFDGKDNALGLLDPVALEEGKLYQVKIKDEFKNIYMAFAFCVNKLNDSLTKETFSVEPNQILSPKWKKVDEIDMNKDSEIFERLSKEKISDKTFDFRYIPSAWIKYNDTYLIWLKAYRSLIEEFDQAFIKNSSKANRKLNGKSNINDILQILKSL